MNPIKKEHYLIWHNIDNSDLSEFLLGVNTNGEIIKETSKTTSYRVGHYFVKKTNYNFFEGILRHNLLSKRCRNIWNISNFLLHHNIPTPKPIAYLEKLKYGLPYQHFFISEYLERSQNVEIFIKNKLHIQNGISLKDFFNALENILLTLWENGIYHKDLSGKNLLTVNGEIIYLVDLDDTHLINYLDIKYKIKNLVQIYDSFCDFVEEEILKDFIFSILNQTSINQVDITYNKIKNLQQQRRTQHIRNICKDKK